MSLADLVAKQKAAQAAKQNDAGSGDSSGEIRENAGSLSSEHKQTEAGSNPAPAIKPGIKFKLGAPKKVTSSDSATLEPTPKAEEEDRVQESTPTEQVSESDDIAPKQESLPGEVPALESNREFPDDATEDMKQFGALVDSVPDLFDDPQVMQQVIRSIMVELQQNPEFMEVMTDEDVNTMIRGMRDVLGLAHVKKVAAKKKAGGSTRKKKSALSDEQTAELDNLFAKLGVS